MQAVRPSNNNKIPLEKTDDYRTATEAPLYLVPNAEGTGKRLVRRPHPPPTTAPLPDDFDAITETRDSTTVYDDAAHSAINDIDYDDLTALAPAPAAAAAHSRPSPLQIHAPAPISPPRNPTSPPRQQRRAASPSHSSLAGPSPDVRGSRHGDDGLNLNLNLNPSAATKARSVAGGDRERERTTQRRSLGVGALSPPFPPGRGPAKGRNELVEKLVIEDGPERTISVWREYVAKNANETGGGGGGGGRASTNVVAHGDDGGAGGGDGDGRSDLDSHIGRRRVSTDSRRRVESLVQGTSGTPSLKGKGHRSRESAEFTEVSAVSTRFLPLCERKTRR